MPLQPTTNPACRVRLQTNFATVGCDQISASGIQVCRCFAIAATIFYWYADALSSLPLVIYIFINFSLAIISMIFEETFFFQVWAEPGPFARQTLQFAGNWDCTKYIITVFPFFLDLTTIFVAVCNIFRLSLAVCKGRLFCWHYGASYYAGFNAEVH